MNTLFEKSMYTEIDSKKLRAAIYCRLSKDEENDGESSSIQNQKFMIEQFCIKQNFDVVGVYQDDGFSGLNMERPDLIKMLKSIERKEIDVVITKDLSRLGRNYIQTGQLIEEYFPKNKVRFIAINDGIDTEKENNEIAPFRNLLNQMYSHDVSKKVHSSYLTKAKQGHFTGCLAPFGYKKNPQNKNQLIIDEETAWIVKLIFEFALDGKGANFIRRKLEDKQIPTPTWWNRQKGYRNKTTKFELENSKTGYYIWDFTTIKEILINPVYIGAIASQKQVYKFKTGWIKDKKPNEWIIVENMHEPIISKEISKGLPIWEFETQKCTTFCLVLEDTIKRLHSRLEQITGEGSEKSFFTVNADKLAGDLLDQLALFLQAHPDTGLIVIDTLQRVRGVMGDKNAYANDYADIGRLKAFADEHDIAILLIHNVRKMPDSDPFNMVSGSVGITGAVDSMYVLEKESRMGNSAVLCVTGRDIEDMQLRLEFDRETAKWKFISYISGEPQEDKVISALVEYLSTRKHFAGSASTLLAELQVIDNKLDTTPNILSRRLKENALALEKQYGVAMQFSRSNNARMISLSVSETSQSVYDEFFCDGDDENTYEMTTVESSHQLSNDDTANQ